MQIRTVLPAVLVVILLASVVGASVVPASQPSSGSSTTETPDEGGSAGASSETHESANYTRLYVYDRYTNLRIKPGENDSVTVTVENAEDHDITISPHLVSLDPRARPIEDDWVTIEVHQETLEPDVPQTRLAPDESAEVTVSVTVPEEAELGDYRSQLAFTNETITYPGQPPRPVHATTLNVDVWREPTVRVISGSRLYTQVEAGESLTHQIIIENTGDEAIPLSPEFNAERRHRYPPGNNVERSWFEIDALNEIPPGETAIVNVTITPPPGADRGRYDADLNLGIRDPTRDERDDYWQRIRLNFQVWKQPDAPFETSFEVSEETAALTLTLSPRTARFSDDSEPVSFDVEFVRPDGTIVEAKRIQVSDRGFVDLSGGGQRVGNQRGDDYSVGNRGQQFVYRLEAPVEGTWSVRIMPHNTIGFGYEVVRNESRE